MVTKTLHKPAGKSVTGDTELMGSLGEKKVTENSLKTLWLGLQGFPCTLGDSLGAGWATLASPKRYASIDGASSVGRDADAAIVGTCTFHRSITLPWLDPLPLSLAGIPLPLSPSPFPSQAANTVYRR